MVLSRPDLPVAAENESRANGFWGLVDERIHRIFRTLMGGPTRYRNAAINIPLAGTPTVELPGPVVGYLCSVGITFNARIVGWSITANFPGTITVDITRSRPLTHPLVENLTGSSQPSCNGDQSESLNMSGWSSTELLDGDTLHFYVADGAGLGEAVLVLRIQDLDERFS
jgi:hypothetical protein